MLKIVISVWELARCLQHFGDDLCRASENSGFESGCFLVRKRQGSRIISRDTPKKNNNNYYPNYNFGKFLYFFIKRIFIRQNDMGLLKVIYRFGDIRVRRNQVYLTQRCSSLNTFNQLGVLWVRVLLSFQNDSVGRPFAFLYDNIVCRLMSLDLLLRLI